MFEQKKIYNFSGSHYEMGFQQGKIFAGFAQNLVDMFKNLEEIQGLKPEPIPTDVFLKYASKKAFRTLNKMLQKLAPNQAERIKGMAEGSGLDEKLLYLYPYNI